MNNNVNNNVNNNEEKRVSHTKTPLRICGLLATIVLSVCMSMSLVTAGFFAVALPDWATMYLAYRYSGTTNSATSFSEDELVFMALAGKHYTFDNNDSEALYDAMLAINKSAADEGRTGQGAPNLEDVSSAADMREVAESASEEYVFDAQAVRHLDDVYQVVAVAKPTLVFLAVLSIVGCVYVGVRKGRRALATLFVSAGTTTLVLFVLLGTWALFDFASLFAVFHSLFFAEGSWVFSSRSLLITCYPTPFWVGMAIVWLAVSCALSVVCVAGGLFMRKGARATR